MTEQKPNAYSALTSPALVLAGAYAAYLAWGALAQSVESTASEGIVVISAKLIVSLLWLAGAWLVARVAKVLVLDGLVAARTGKETPGIITNSLSIFIFLIAILFIVGIVFEQPVGAVVATSGVITLVIGFALRELIADFFSGMAINLEQPYQIGDWVELEPSLVGKVTAINWRATRLLTQDKRMVIIPNNVLAGRMLINYNLPTPVYRENMDLVLDYNIEPRRVENIVMAAIKATPGIVEDGKHRVRIDGFTDRGVLIEIKFWIKDYADRIPVRHGVAVNVLDFLAQAGIAVPYAQHDLFLSRQRPRERERRIDTERLLARLDLFEELTLEERARLAQTVIGREYRSKEVVIREGGEDSTLFVVVEGVLSVSIMTPQGQQQRVGRVLPGQSVGEMSLLTGAPRTATVSAETDAYVLVVDRADMEPILRERPETADALSRLMAMRQLATQRSLEDEEESEESAVLSTSQQIRAKIRTFFGLG